MARKVGMSRLVAVTLASVASMAAGCACHKPHQAEVNARAVTRAAESQEIDAEIMAGYTSVLHELTMSVEHASQMVDGFALGSVAATNARAAILAARGRLNVVRAYLRAIEGRVPRDELRELAIPVRPAETVLSHAQVKFEQAERRQGVSVSVFDDAQHLENTRMDIEFHQKVLEVEVTSEPASADVFRLEHGSAAVADVERTVSAFESRVHLLEVWFAGAEANLSAADRAKVTAVIRAKRRILEQFQARVRSAVDAWQRINRQ